MWWLLNIWIIPQNLWEFPQVLTFYGYLSFWTSGSSLNFSTRTCFSCFMHVNQPLLWFAHSCTQGHVCVHVSCAYVHFTKDGDGQRCELHLSKFKHTHMKETPTINNWILDTLDPQSPVAPLEVIFHWQPQPMQELMLTLSLSLVLPLSTPISFLGTPNSHFFHARQSVSPQFLFSSSALGYLCTSQPSRYSAGNNSSPSLEGSCK